MAAQQNVPVQTISLKTILSFFMGVGSLLTSLAVLMMASINPIAFAADSAANLIEEVVVTAQKREQNVNDVSLSISVFDSEDLDYLQIQNPYDVAKLTPGLYATSDTSGRPIFTLRGVGMNNGASNQNPAVTPYIDEIALPSVSMLNFKLFDLERVEVLKGPQGTLYGRNVTGGAINFVTNKPSKELDGYVNFDYGHLDTVNVEAAIGGPISEGLAARIAAYSNTRNGYQTIIKTGPDFNPDINTDNGAIDRQGFRASLLWEPADSIRWSTQVEGHFDDSETLGHQHAGNVDDSVGGLCSYPSTGIRDDGPGRCVSYAIVRDAVGGSPVTGDREVVFDSDDDPYTVFGSFTYGNMNRSDVWGINNNVSFDIGNLTLTSVTGWRDTDRTVAGDNGSPFVVSDTLSEQDIEVISQEIRLASDNSGDITWLVGLYYSKDEIDDLIFFNYRDHVAFSGLFHAGFYQEAESLGAFGQAEWQMTDALRFIGGVRYTDESREFDYTSGVTGTGAPVPVATFSDSISEDKVSGRIGIDYTPTDDILIYASASKGFKGPGFPSTISFSTGQLAPFNSETLFAYEIGAKVTLADGRLQWNTNGYYYDWENFQATTSVTRQGIRLIVLGNAGDVEIYGIDSEAAFAVSDEITIRAGLNWTETEILNGDRINDTLVQAPTFSANIIAAYDAEQPYSGFLPFMYIDYSYRESVELALPNRTAEVQDGYGLVGMRAGVRTETEKWEISGWVRNLADKKYRLSSFGAGSTFLPGRQLWAEPRTYGISLRYTF